MYLMVTPHSEYLNEKEYSNEDINFWFEELKLHLIKNYKIFIDKNNTLSSGEKFNFLLKRRVLSGFFIFQLESGGKMKILPKGQWPIGELVEEIYWREYEE